MTKIMFFAISLLIYFGAFELSKAIFCDGDLSLFLAAILGGICFWWLVSKSDKID
jgi:hypothetical protein